MNGLNAASSAAQSVGGKIGSAMKTIATVGGAALTAASGAVVAFGKSAIDEGRAFDASMAQVAATMGKTVDEISNLRDFAREMGAKTAFSATEAADALNYMALAGYDAETSMRMLPNVLNLAAAGGMELAAASDMVTDSQSALGLSLEQTEALVDKMAKASSKSNTSVSQLGDAILTVGGTAKAMKGGTTELAQVLGIIADNGVKGAEGGTALRNIILSLTAPTDNAAKTLKNLGVSALDSSGNMRSMKDIFADLNNAMSGMSEGKKTAVLSEIFNKVDLKSVNALMGTNIERWDELSAAIDDCAGAAQQMAETQLDNLEGDLKIFGSALSEAKLTLSDQLMPAMREFVQFGTQGITAVTDAFKREDTVRGLSDAIRDAEGNLLSAGQVAGVLSETLYSMSESDRQIAVREIFGTDDMEYVNSLLSETGEGYDELIGYVSNIDAVAESTNGWSAAMQALGPTITDAISMVMEGLPQVIEIGGQLLGAVVTGIIDNLPILAEGAVQVATSFGEYLIEAAPNIAEKGVELINFIGDGLLTGIPALTEKAAEIAPALAQGLAEGIPAAAGSVAEAVNSLATLIGENAPFLIDSGLQLLEGLATGIAEGAPKLMESATTIVTVLMETLSDPNALGGITESGMAIIEGLVTGILDNLPRLADSASQMIRNFGEYLRDNLPQIAERGLELLESLSGSLRENAGKLIDAGLDMLLNLAQGFADSIPALIEHVPTIISNIAGVINDNAPKILATGVKIIITIAKGIVQAIPTLIANFPKILKAIVDVWTAFNWLNLGKNAVEFIKNGINTLKTKIPEALKNIANTAKEWFKNVDWPAVGKSVLDFIKSGINALRTTVPETLKNIAHTAMEWFKSVDWHGLGKTVLDLIKKGINTLKEVIPNALRDIANAAKDKFTSIDWLQVGKDLLHGIWNGIVSVKDWVLGKVGGLVSDIMARFTGPSGFDEHSPSKWAKRVGEYVSIGLANGIEGKASEVTDAAEKMASDTYTALSKWADKTAKRESLALAEQLEMWKAIQSQFDEESDQWWDARDKVLDIESKIASERAQSIKNQYNDLIRSVEYNVKRFGWSTRTQLSMYTEIRDQFERNSEEWLDADDKVFDARQKLAKEEEDALKSRADAWKNYAADVQKATESVNELEANYQKELAKRAGEIANSYKLFAEVPTPKEINGRDLLNNLQNQVKSIGRFYANIEKLAERGVNEALVAEIRAMGVGASDELNALLSLSDRQLSQYAALYEEKQSLANSIALDELSELRVETDNKIMESLQSIGDLYDEYAPTIGASLGEGLAEGIRNGMKEAVDAAEALANAVQIKLDALGANGLQIAWDSASAPAFSGDFAPSYDYASATRTMEESYGYDNRAAYGRSAPIEVNIANSVAFDGRKFAFNMNSATAYEANRRGGRLID